VKVHEVVAPIPGGVSANHDDVAGSEVVGFANQIVREFLGVLELDPLVLG
jgi:hypothetical protein